MIYTACSLNSEIWGSYTDVASEEKLPLHEYGLTVAGSSATVALAVRATGRLASVVGLVGPPSVATTFLEMAAQLSGLSLHPLEVLDETSLALLPIDNSRPKNKVAGKKGKVIPEKLPAALRYMSSILAPRTGDSTVALTGLRLEELPFAQEVFRLMPRGKVIVSPRTEFCGDPAFSGILESVGCVVLNEVELRNTRMSAEEICSKGPRMVVVTLGKDGGYCQLQCGQRIKYESVERTEGESPGTGDWFLGSFLGYLDRLDGSFLTFDSEIIEKALHFAATVAGRKAPIPGASNGPETLWIRQLLCKE